MNERSKILQDNFDMREGRLPGAQRLPDGEVAFAIPKEDFKVITRIFPELVSKDHSVRLAAWHKLRKSPIGERYLVTRTPRQVQRSQRGIIVK